jgi:hypothetical protein
MSGFLEQEIEREMFRDRNAATARAKAHHDEAARHAVRVVPDDPPPPRPTAKASLPSAGVWSKTSTSAMTMSLSTQGSKASLPPTASSTAKLSTSGSQARVDSTLEDRKPVSKTLTSAMSVSLSSQGSKSSLLSTASRTAKFGTTSGAKGEVGHGETKTLVDPILEDAKPASKTLTSALSVSLDKQGSKSSLFSAASSTGELGATAGEAGRAETKARADPILEDVKPVSKTLTSAMSASLSSQGSNASLLSTASRTAELNDTGGAKREQGRVDQEPQVEDLSVSMLHDDFEGEAAHAVAPDDARSGGAASPSWSELGEELYEQDFDDV